MVPVDFGASDNPCTLSKTVMEQAAVALKERLGIARVDCSCRASAMTIKDVARWVLRAPAMQEIRKKLIDGACGRRAGKSGSARGSASGTAGGTVSVGEMSEKLETTHASGIDLLKDVTKLNHSMQNYKIQIDMDSLPPVYENEAQRKAILKKMLWIMAAKALFLKQKYGSNKILFEFVKKDESGAFIPVTTYGAAELYMSDDEELRIVKKHGLYISNAKKDDYQSSFLIVAKDKRPADYKGRIIALEEPISIEDDSGLAMWNGILDLAIAQTILLAQDSTTRASYYGALAGLYKLLGKDVEEAAIAKLLDADIQEAIKMALQLAIPACGRFKVGELLELYEKMRNLMEQA
jgi:hypothetical protein